MITDTEYADYSLEQTCSMMREYSLCMWLFDCGQLLANSAVKNAS